MTTKNLNQNQDESPQTNPTAGSDIQDVEIESPLTAENSEISSTDSNYKISELQTKINSLELEVDDWKSKSLRIAADLQNLQKQHELDSVGIRKRVKKDVINPVISFVNTLNLAFAFSPETQDEKVLKFVKTLKFSFETLLKDLNSQNIKIIIPEIGTDFDAETMTALNVPEDNETAKVKQIVSVGVEIDKQLIQPVSVMI